MRTGVQPPRQQSVPRNRLERLEGEARPIRPSGGKSEPAPRTEGGSAGPERDARSAQNPGCELAGSSMVGCGTTASEAGEGSTGKVRRNQV